MREEDSLLMKVKVIEDDPILARGLQLNFELEGYQVQVCSSLQSALKLYERQKFDFVILDLGLPDGTGFTYLENVRKTDTQTPIIILTAQTDEDSVIRGLQSGANDYMKKPYSFKELLVRMKVVTRKPAVESKKLTYENLVLNIDARSSKYNDQPFELNRREFDILAHFVQRAEMIVSRDSILSLINRDGEIFDRTIDSHISHLRKKLRSHGILNFKISSVYGLGYRLEMQNSERSDEK